MFNRTVVKGLISLLKSHIINIIINNLEISKLNDNRSFWKIIVPLFPKKKTQKAKKLTRLEKVKISQTMLDCVVFSVIIFWKSFPI